MQALPISDKRQQPIDLLPSFIQAIASGEIEVYNEFSLQHELGVFLRNNLIGDKTQFERNVKSLFPGRPFTKKEIDIAVLSSDLKELKWAVELKFPRNGQYPEQMFSFCRDIVFLEELKEAGFSCATLLVLAEDDLFWRGSGEGLYGFFRGGRALHGPVCKPTGSKDGKVEIRGTYAVKWERISDNLRFFALSVDEVSRYVLTSDNKTNRERE